MIAWLRWFALFVGAMLVLCIVLILDRIDRLDEP